MKKVFDVDVSKIDIEEINNQDFMKLKIYAISDQENRNHSEFLYEGFEESIKTMYNKPILAYYNSDLGDTEAHNSRLNIDEEGIYSDYQYEGGEKPVGVIPESANIYVEEKDGKNWIVIDGCIIWTEYNRQLYKLIKKQLKKKVSVEVEVLDYYEEEDIAKFKSWKFLGITILGKDPEDGSIVEEGIEGAHLQLKEIADSPTFNRYMSKLSFALQENEKVELAMRTYNELQDKLHSYIRQYVEGEDEDCYYRYYIQDIMLDTPEIILYDYEESKYYKTTYTIGDDDEVTVDMENLIELERIFVEKYSSCEHEKEFLYKKDTALSVSKKEENMNEFIKSAEEAGFVCLGLLDGKLKFVKKFSIEGEDVVEIEKIDIYSIEKEKCEEDFVEENLTKDAFEDDKDEDDKDDDKEPENDDNDDGEDDNKVDEAKEAEEAEKEAKFAELEAEKEALSTELETVKAELQEIKNANFEKETNAILDDEKELDEEVKATLISMRNEAKFATVEDFVKELCYMQYVRKEKKEEKEESSKLDFSVSKPSVVVTPEAGKTMKERLQEI